jgi:hypothetical protein
VGNFANEVIGPQGHNVGVVDPFDHRDLGRLDRDLVGGIIRALAKTLADVRSRSSRS